MQVAPVTKALASVGKKGSAGNRVAFDEKNGDYALRDAGRDITRFGSRNRKTSNALKVFYSDK